jgi:exonuclease SbcD
VKILCAPDLHCWWSTYEKDPFAKVPTRLDEWKLCSEEIVAICLEHKIEVALFPGDYFVESHPHPRAVKAVLDLFITLESVGVKVIGLSGNHDNTGPGQESFVDVIGVVNPSWGATKPTIVEYKDISFVMLPSMKPIEVCSGTYKDVSDTLTIMAEEMHCAAKGKQVILLAHWSTDESVFVNGFKPPKMVEPTLWLECLKGMHYDACVLGHIHKPQVLCQDPLIFHTGVMTRGKSDEGKVSCGAYILNTVDYTIEYYELPARELCHIKFPQEQMEDFDSGDWLNTINTMAVDNAIVTASYQISEDNVTKVRYKDIIDALYTLGAYYVEGIHPTVIKNNRQRVAEVTEETDEVESFRKWYEQSGHNPDLAESTTRMFEEILDEVR